MGGVIISPNMKHTRVMIDPSGNEINPETKEILKVNDPGYIPTKEEVEAKINIPQEPVKPDLTKQQIEKLNSMAFIVSGETIQQQIEATKRHLIDLELLKKEEIKKKKAELAELEAE